MRLKSTILDSILADDLIKEARIKESLKTMLDEKLAKKEIGKSKHMRWSKQIEMSNLQALETLKQRFEKQSQVGNFAKNVKSTMLKLHKNEKLSNEEMQHILQYYLEVVNTTPAMKNFAENIKDTMMKVKNNKPLSNDEKKNIVQFYLESLRHIASKTQLNKIAGFESHLDRAMEQLGYNKYSWELQNDQGENVLVLKGAKGKGMINVDQYKELAQQLKPDFNASYSDRHEGLVFGAVTPLFNKDLKFGKQAAEPVNLEKVIATLQKGLPGLVTTLNMSAQQAESIYKVKPRQKNAHRAYKKLVFAANLVQESLTLLGKVKLKEEPKPAPVPAPEPAPAPEAKPQEQKPAAAPAPKPQGQMR